MNVADVLVVGSGAAGLVAALGLAGAGRVVVLTRERLGDANTALAQGGIAAALGPDDSPDEHLADTLAAGAGLSEPAAVRVLVEEGPARVLELVRLGARFDRRDGRLALGREAAHRRARVVHAQDATGAEVLRTLAQALATSGVEVLEGYRAIDLLVRDGRCAGLVALGPDGHLHRFEAPVTILATGGAGQAYLHTTNPALATGDGIAMAWRAGVEIADMEFVQFHPTALYHEGSPRVLVTEAIRGEGAVLLNRRGERFLSREHPQAELAPRDVVARAIWAEMERAGDPHVWLDARGVPGVRERFPTVTEGARKHGFDIARDLLPVTPAAHYLMGGIRTGPDGATSLPGLYACGEAACTGVHGANRLASNSLLEALVFGRRAAAAARGWLREVRKSRPPAGPAAAPGDRAGSDAPEAPLPAGDPAAIVREVKRLMWERVGIVREGTRLAEAVAHLERLRDLAEAHVRARLSHAALDARNVATVALLIARAALARRESRGSHCRRDFPEPAGGVRPVHSVQADGRGLWWRESLWS